MRSARPTDLTHLVRTGFARLEEADRWLPALTPPLPTVWPPASRVDFVYYAFAMRLRSGPSDGHEVAAPWALIGSREGEGWVLEPLHRGRLSPLGIQRVRPATPEVARLFEEVRAAGGLEALLCAAGREPRAARLTRRWYEHWQSLDRVGQSVIHNHPAFAAYLADS